MLLGAMTSRPCTPVSVVMAVLNEGRHLRSALEHVLSQDYPGELEVVVAVGPCRDGTREIARSIAAADPRVHVVDNPSPVGATPAGLNAALAASHHDVVVRVDGHSMLPPDYVRVGVATLEGTGAANVGGLMAAEGRTPFEQAVAVAMTSKLGVGSAPFHTGGGPGPVDTVYLGVFRRSALLAAGGYDEGMARAQDWELNHRIRQAGGVVWFQPQMRVSYRPRGTIAALARQYFQYGRWRREVARRHPGTLTPRYLAPPVTLVAVVAGSVAGLAGVRSAWALPAGYAITVLGGSSVLGHDLPPPVRLRLPVTIAVMHAAWALGFLTSSRHLAQPRAPQPSGRLG